MGEKIKEKKIPVGLEECLRSSPSCAGVGLSPALLFVTLSLCPSSGLY